MTLESTPPAGVGLVTFVVVHYGDSADTRHLLESLVAQEHPGWRAVVVDNGPGGSVDLGEYAALVGQRLEVLHPDGNLGYLPAAAVAIARARDARDPVSAWVISNHDVVYDADFVSRLVERLARPEAFVGAPSIRAMPSGRDENPFMGTRPSALREAAMRLVLSSDLLYRTAEWRHERSRSEPEPERAPDAPESRIYAAHGSCFVVTESALARGLSLDGAPFLYGEERFLARRAESAGVPVIYLPQLRVTHHAHATTGALSVSDRRRLQQRALRQPPR